MGTLSTTIAPSPHLASMAAMGMMSSCLSGPAVGVVKRTPPSFTVGVKGGRGHRRNVMLPLSSSSSSSSRMLGSGSAAARSFGGGSRLSTFSLPVSGPRGPAAAAVDNAGGLGIAEFLGGKNFLITGGTGFLAKGVLIEKILRTNPDVGRIYVMIKAKDTEAALKRLQTEVADTELFKCLREIHGEEYQAFVARKLVPVVGDIREANLGISPELADVIAEEVDIVVNSAGNTNFRERYDVAMDINTLGQFRIMSFLQRFRRLKLFLHLSTAYVNGQRQGVVLEKPFRLGDSIAKELGSSGSSDHNAILDIEEEIKLAFNARRSSYDSASFSQEMKDLGLARAKVHGWQDTYVFTKAMGEMVINSMRGEIPVVIIRPSIIESTLKEPFPGWIQGNRMVDPVILNYGKGQMTSFLGDPDCVFDVIPADMVVNATLASMAKHGGGARPGAPSAGIHVYQVASSAANPLLYRDLFGFFLEHFTRSPLADAAGRPIPVAPIRFRSSMEQYARDVEANALLSRRRAAVEQMLHLGRIYEAYTFYGGRFDGANTAALHAEMSEEERAAFHLDARGVDWRDYFTNVHIPGLKKHVVKGRGVAGAA
ncbi:hypothetical protein ACP70R_020692 [Stipagrostis hirtigluma subsp. patula]